MTGNDFRSLALSLPDAVEAEHMGHPDFRVNGRIFATLSADEDFGMVKVLPEQQASYISAAPEVFKPASGAWGRQGCTIVDLKGARKATIRRALGEAHEIAAKQPPPRKRKK